MASFTRTMTEAGYGRRPLLHGVAPEQTFWGSLGEMDRMASVATSRGSTTIGSKLGWHLAGRTLAYWEETLYHRLECIRVNRKRHIIGKTEWAILVHPFMRGTTLEDVKPTIVITCYDEGTAKRLFNLIRHDREFQTSGFGLFAWNGDFLRRAGVGCISGIIDQHGRAYSGAIIKARSFSGAERVATLGGLVVIQGEVFGLTTAHTFDSSPNAQQNIAPTSHSKVPGFEIDLDADDTSLNSFNQDSDVEFCFEEDTIGTRTRIFIGEPPSPMSDGLGLSQVFSAGDLKIGTFINHPKLSFRDGKVSEHPFANMCLDWALITMDAKPLQTKGHLYAWSVFDLYTDASSRAPFGKVIVSFQHRERSAIGTGVTSMVCLPGSDTFTRTYTIQYSCEDGDCGAWVQDSNSTNTYGAIIGDSRTLGLTYIIPMQDILADISNKWGLDYKHIPSGRLRPEFQVSEHGPAQLHQEGPLDPDRMAPTLSFDQSKQPSLSFGEDDDMVDIKTESIWDDASYTGTGISTNPTSVSSAGSNVARGILGDTRSSKHHGRLMEISSKDSHLRCRECSRLFSSNYSLRKHLRVHKKPLKCPFPDCLRAEIGFSSQNDLDRHKTVKHNSLD